MNILNFCIICSFIIFQCIWSALSQSKLLPCQLKWRSHIAGEEFPKDVVQLTDRYFIASISRCSGVSCEVFVGMADNTTKEARFYPFPQTPFTSFSVLTNPNDCAVSWVDAPFGDIQEPEYSLPVGSRRYVALRKSDGLILGGTLILSDISEFHAVDPNTLEAKKFLACETLKSTENLRMVVSHLEVSQGLTNQPPDPDFMGLDTIENDSPAEVEHKVRHQTGVTIRYELQEANSFAQSTHTVVDVSLNIAGLTLGVNWENKHDSASGSLTTIVKETEEVATSSRTIIVPPYTKLEACSILFNAKGEAMPSKGQASFSITGRNSDFVKNIILGEGYSESEILYTNGSHVFVSIVGAFSIESPMRTKLFVHEIGDPAGCQSIQKILSDLKRLRQFRPEQKTDIYELEQMFKRMTRET